MRIVIVEDEAPIREGMEGILKKMDDSWLLMGKAENGLKGLEMIRRERPDVVIMDIRMPDMDGLTMLETLRREGINCRAVILSAYSDFSYAKRALELDVSNYLLKPVRIHELQKALRQLEEEIREENRQNAFLSLENVVRGAMMGILERTEETEAVLEKKYGIHRQDELVIFTVWLGCHFEERRDITMRILREVSEHAEGFCSAVSAFPEWTQCTLFVYRMQEGRDWEAWFNSSVVPMLISNTDKKAVCVWEECGSFFDLEECSRRSRQTAAWNLSVGNGRLLSRRYVESLSVLPLKYPPELSVRVRQSVIKRDRKEFEACFIEFINCCKGQTYHPKDIREACITFLWTVLNTARESVIFPEDGVEVQGLLERLMKAFSWEDIYDCMDGLFQAVDKKTMDQHEESPLIQRTRHLIEEYYSQGITLEEAARSLLVSPEYLSRQYKKETGLSFTEEIRRVKVEKVKTLLLGTGLNLTQIAAMTGFTDPKYMSKVFKEEVGVLPAEYRKMNL